MKWLKKIFSKENAVEDSDVEAPVILALSHVKDWLEERSQEPELERNLRSLYDSIERVAKDLEGDLSALEGAEPKEGTSLRLLKAGSAAREKLVRQMRGLSDRVAPPAKADLISAREYHSTMMKHLQNTVQKFGRAQRYTAAIFPREVEMINSDLGTISRHLSDLGEMISEREASLEAFGEAAGLASQVRERRDQIESLKAEIAGDEELLATLRDQERGHQQDIETWSRSDEGRRNFDERKVMEQKLRERDQIEMGMADLVSPLAKAVSRIMKQDDSDRIALQHREVFKELSSSPVRALEGDVSGALLELKSKVDLLGLRDKKRDRIIEQIEHLLEDRPLEVLKARHHRLNGEIEDLEKSLSKSGRETARLREKRDQVRQKTPSLEAAIEERRKGLAALEERLSKDLADLKEKLEEIAGEVLEIDLLK